MAAKAVDLSEFVELSKRQYPRCGVAKVLERLDPAQTEAFRAALQEPTITHIAISRWLAARGLKVAYHIIGHHRTGKCCCDD